MKTELLNLTYVTAFTGILWVPYILERTAVRGLMSAVSYPENPKPQSAWAQRLMKAHANAVENLVIFATLVLVAQAAGVSNDATVMASVVYLWARIVHAAAYTFKVPLIRTLGFVVGVGAQGTFAWQILAQA